MNKFKKGLCCFALVLLQAQPLQAQDSEGMKVTADGLYPLNDEWCGPMIGDLMASLFMTMRQLGKPMSEAMAEASSSDEVFGLDGTFRAMVIEAYEAPRFSTVEHKESAIADFVNKWTLSCYKAPR